MDGIDISLVDSCDAHGRCEPYDTRTERFDVTPARSEYQVHTT